MFVVVVTFAVADEFAARFHEAVVVQANNSLLEPGCARFDVCVDPTDARRIFLYELYRDEASFRGHLASPHFLEFDKLVGPWTLDKQVTTWQLLHSPG